MYAEQVYLRIGQIAKRSGASEKALRLYGERGLLPPCAHSPAGYRLYGPAALRRLMQIVVLKRSGFSLAAIANLLNAKVPVIGNLLSERIATLEQEILNKTRALRALREVATRMDSTSTLSLDKMLESINLSQQADLYAPDLTRQSMRERAESFSAAMAPDEFDRARRRLDEVLATLNPEGLEARQASWRELGADIRAALAAGLAPDHADIHALTFRWQSQLAPLQKADPQFLTKLRDLYEKRPELMADQSLTPAMIDYMAAAMQSTQLEF